MAFLCVSKKGELKKHHKKLFWGTGEVHVKKNWPKKLRKDFFPVVFSLRFFLSRFFAVSLHDEPKNTIKVMF
jgi:hypothetical protein